MGTTLPIVGYIQQGNEYMPVYEGGFIARETGRDVPASYCKPSGKWVLRGAVERNNFGNAVREYSQAEVLSGKIVWHHKNRRQKVFLLDCDHGTNREWSSGVFLRRRQA